MGGSRPRMLYMRSGCLFIYNQKHISQYFLVFLIWRSAMASSRIVTGSEDRCTGDPKRRCVQFWNNPSGDAHQKWTIQCIQLTRRTRRFVRSGQGKSGSLERFRILQVCTYWHPARHLSCLLHFRVYAASSALHYDARATHVKISRLVASLQTSG